MVLIQNKAFSDARGLLAYGTAFSRTGKACKTICNCPWLLAQRLLALSLSWIWTNSVAVFTALIAGVQCGGCSSGLHRRVILVDIALAISLAIVVKGQLEEFERLPVQGRPGTLCRRLCSFPAFDKRAFVYVTTWSELASC